MLHAKNMSYSMTFVPVLFLLLLFPHEIKASFKMESTPLIQGENQTKINKNLYIAEDKEKKWTIDDVISNHPSIHFKQNDKHIPNFGYTSSAYWTAFTIENQTSFTERLLEIPYPPLHEIDVYIYKDNKLIDELNL